MQDFEFVMIGGGIVGLSVAWSILENRPSSRLAMIEKETHWARPHQTGRNSGVIRCTHARRSLPNNRISVALNAIGKLAFAMTDNRN
jgi:L-2-hydroxyglutarate oxidase LhgO